MSARKMSATPEIRKKYQENVSKPPAPDGRGPYPLEIRIRELLTETRAWAARAAKPGLSYMPAGILPVGQPKTGPITKYAMGRKHTMVRAITMANIVAW